ncbi:serine hydrolase domain-containing protein [Ktedonosporobacter rubrisoli]|uniref:serine hydrolase domain-containing protein n=1 Tax=Ktedonosporobacter rubrisoli TaxID=2509675 RepID=UPI0013EE8B8E|nr:serine hydrolase domain-containing protein [Ktedonosporobacter rubrisoli]
MRSSAVISHPAESLDEQVHANNAMGNSTLSAKPGKRTFSGIVQIPLKRFEESGVALLECPGCGKIWTLSPRGGVLRFKSHDKRQTTTPATGMRWTEGNTNWGMAGEEKTDETNTVGLQRRNSMIQPFEEAIHCLDQSIRQFMQTTPIGGLTLALTDRHHLLHTAHYGYADIAAQVPVTAETRFEICSITKTFTSLAVMQQYEAGTLDIHAPITSYLPWFQVQSTYEEPITAHHLMSHTAGLVAGSERSLGSRHAIWLLRETELAYAPGTAFHYSDVGYETLGALLEIVLGQRFPAILQRQILDPLEMRSSFPSNTYEGRKVLALGYHSFYDDRPSHRSHPLAPAPWFEYESPAGCVLSTARDMAVYLRMYLNRGQGPHRRLLSEKSFDLMTQAIVPGTFGHIGYGLFTQKVDGHLYLNHPGGMLGYESMMLGDLDEGLGVVVLLSGKCWPWPWQLAHSALSLLRAAQEEHAGTVMASVGEQKKIANASDYAETFTGRDGSLTFIVEADQVILLYQGNHLILEELWPDTFFIPHPDFAYFLGHFGRASGRIVEFEHGASWWIHEQRYTGPRTFVYPAEWDAYPGHYVSESPWTGHVRIILRKGHLYLVEAEGYERELFPLGERSFGYKRNRTSKALPERVRFDAMIDGQAWCLTLAGNDSFIRVRTP